MCALYKLYATIVKRHLECRSVVRNAGVGEHPRNELCCHVRRTDALTTVDISQYFMRELTDL